MLDQGCRVLIFCGTPTLAPKNQDIVCDILIVIKAVLLKHGLYLQANMGSSASAGIKRMTRSTSSTVEYR